MYIWLDVRFPPPTVRAFLSLPLQAKRKQIPDFKGNSRSSDGCIVGFCWQALKKTNIWRSIVGFCWQVLKKTKKTKISKETPGAQIRLGIVSGFCFFWSFSVPVSKIQQYIFKCCFFSVPVSNFDDSAHKESPGANKESLGGEQDSPGAEKESPGLDSSISKGIPS